MERSVLYFRSVLSHALRSRDAEQRQTVARGRSGRLDQPQPGAVQVGRRSRRRAAGSGSRRRSGGTSPPAPPGSARPGAASRSSAAVATTRGNSPSAREQRLSRSWASSSGRTPPAGPCRCPARRRCARPRPSARARTARSRRGSRWPPRVSRSMSRTSSLSESSARQRVPGRVHADQLDHVVQRDHVPGPLGHLDLLAVLAPASPTGRSGPRCPVRVVAGAGAPSPGAGRRSRGGRRRACRCTVEAAVALVQVVRAVGGEVGLLAVGA